MVLKPVFKKKKKIMLWKDCRELINITQKTEKEVFFLFL